MRIERRGQHRRTYRASRRTVLAFTGVLAVGACASVAVVLLPLAASAAGTPPFEPDSNAVGSISFFTAAGTPVTGGNLADPIAAYAQGSVQPDAGDVKAALFGYLPKNGQVPGQFSGENLTGASVYPNASAPGSLGTSALPLDSISSIDATFGNLVSDFPNTATDSYAGLYEIRMRTSQPGSTASATYDRADIQVSNVVEDGGGNVTGGTWTVVYPAPPVQTVTATSTVLTAAPSPGTVGHAVTLSATESPAAAGSVQFKDGSTALGAPVAVNGSGVATTSTSSLTAGTHALSAVFTPTDPTSFGSSTGTASETVTAPVAASTSVALVVSPPTPQAVGTNATLTATITPSAAAGSVQFFDGSTQLGANVTVSGGTASTSTSTLAVGTHSLTATFVPADSGAYQPSTSAASSYVVTGQPAASTTTSFAVSPAGPIAFGAAATLEATVSPSAAGSVQFLDGSTDLGAPVLVKAGVASVVNTTLASGTHQLSARFVPADAAAYQGSTSSATQFVVDAQATTTALAVTPAGPVTHGTSVTLAATLSPATAVGTVQFMDGANALGSPTPVSGGTAQLSTAGLSVATHSLTAVFTATSSAAYLGSTSTAATLEVDPAPAGATDTSLVVTPAGPVVTGSPVALRATVDQAAATGTVQFEDGGVALGSPVAVTSGVATLTTTSLPLGSHSLSAVFTSADTTVFLDSSSAVVTLVVIAPPTTTTTTVTTSPGTAQTGDPVTITAAVTPSSAAGTVQFADNGTALGGPVALTSGSATATVAFSTVGSHSITASFTPTSATAYAPSTGTATFAVTQPVTSDNVAATDASGAALTDPVTLVDGQVVTVTITGAGANAVLTVTLHSTPVVLGTVTANASGTATFSLTVPTGLASGSHTLVFSNGSGTAVGQFAFAVTAPSTPTPTSPATPGATPGATSGTDGSGSLAKTGSDIGMLGGIGAGLVAAGAVIMLAARRRGRHA